MDVKPGYKQAEIGVIPDDWEVKHLPDVCRFRGGKAHEKFISELGKYICVNSKFISTEGDVRKYSNANFCCAKKYDILMVMSDLPNGKALAKAFIADVDNLYAVNQRVCSLTAYRDDPKYLFYVLNRNPYFLKFNDGVNQTHLLNHVFQKCLVPLPQTLAEQQAIAEALSDTDTLIESLEQLITKKRQIKQGAMQELLTGKRRLPDFSGDWEEVQLKELAIINNGYAFKSNTYSQTGKYNVVTIANVQDGFMDLSECNKIQFLPNDIQQHHILKHGDILISMTGNVGRVCKVYFTDCLLNQRVGKLTPSSVDASFLYALLRQRHFIESMTGKAKGGAQGNLSVSDILEFTFHCPIQKAEQNAIATILSDMDAEITALEQKLSKARQIKQGMMQELLTGRIRLV